MARPGILVKLYDDLQHWRYNDPIKDAELMSLRFVKPINLNRQMVVIVGDPMTLVGCQGKIRSGYSCSEVEHWSRITCGNIIWASDKGSVYFEDGSTMVNIFGGSYHFKKSKTTPELIYYRGDQYYEVALATRNAKIRCPVLDNPLAYLLEASELY